MTSIIKKPLFWTNIAAFLFAGWLVAGIAFGWTNPGSVPPGGSGAITVDNNGNVGVGVSVPTQKLDVNGNVKGTGLCIGTDCRAAWPAGITGGGTVNYLSKFTSVGAIGNSQIFDNGTNVGIGTPAPNSKLEVKGSQVGISVMNAANTQNYYFGINDADSNKLYIGRGKDPSQGIAPAVVVTPSNNVGIGTAAPAQQLDVAGNVQWSGVLTAGSVPWVRLTGIPGPCGAGQFVTNMSTGGCAAPAAPAWTSITGIPVGFADNVDDTGGNGTLTSINAGQGITLSPNPITTTGTIAVKTPIIVSPGGQFAQCPAGTVVIGGGHYISGTCTQLNRSCPSNAGNLGCVTSGATAWRVSCTSGFADAYAICL